MQMAALLLSGSLAGLSIAMPVGPFSLLCIQRSLRGGFLPGFSTGLGGATTNAVVAVVLLCGSQHLLPALPGGGRALSAAGGLLLLWSAARLLEAGSLSTATARTERAVGCVAAYVSAAGFNAANPLALALVFAALSPVLSLETPSTSHAAVVVASMVLTSTAWYAGLCLLASLMRARLGATFLGVANRVAGMVLIVYAAITLARACRF